MTWLWLLACRPDPGDPAYPDLANPGGDDTAEDDDFLDGPVPYEDGDARLSLGLFYEGDASESLPVDDVTRFYYIYDSSYTQSVDVIDRVEGYQSDVLIHAGGAWWGGGVSWSSPEDLSAWTGLSISFQSSSLQDFTVRLTGGEIEGSVSVTDHGFAADGAWHHLQIPLSAFTEQGVDLTSVTAPLVLVGETGAAGDELRVDDLYFTADE